MTANPVGYVVIEWNQASGRPDVLGESFRDDRAEAEELAAEERALTASFGRRERYAVAEVVPIEEPSC